VIFMDKVASRPSAGHELIDLAIDALTTYRITRLVVEDEIAAPMRDRVWDRWPPDSTRVGYLITCPWCVSVWVGAGVVAARAVAPAAWRPLSGALALSALAGVVSQRV